MKAGKLSMDMMGTKKVPEEPWIIGSLNVIIKQSLVNKYNMKVIMFITNVLVFNFKPDSKCSLNESADSVDKKNCAQNFTYDLSVINTHGWTC